MDNANVTVDYELQSAQAEAALKRLDGLLSGITARFNTHVQTTQKGLDALIARMDKMGDSWAEGTRKRERALSDYLKAQGQSDLPSNRTPNAVNKAATDGAIADVVNATQASLARISDAIVKAAVQQLRTTDAAISARIAAETRKVDKLIRDNDQSYQDILRTREAFSAQRTTQIYGNPELLAARANLNAFSDDKTIREGQDIALQRAKANRDEIRNIQLKEQYLDEEKRALDAQIRQQRDITRRYRADNFVDPVVKQQEKDAEQQLKNSLYLQGVRERSRAAEEKEAQQRIKNSLYLQGIRDRTRQLEERAELTSQKEAQAAFDQIAANARYKIRVIQASRRNEELAEKAEQRAAAERLKAADIEFNAAQQTLQAHRRDKAIAAANNVNQFGSTTAPSDPFARLNNNGGADLLAIQGRLMANYAVVGSLFYSVQSLVSGLIELDKELHEFQAISTATNAEMVKFKENLLDITSVVPFTVTELAQASTLLAQAGLSTTQVIASLGDIAKFATAAGTDLASGVDIVTSSMTAFNLSSERTGEVANTLTSALNLSKLSVDRLRTSLAYVGPTANEVGMSLQETVSVLGALAQSGIGASTIGTGTRALLVDLQNPSEKLRKNMQALGISMQDINVEGKGLVPVVEALSKAGFGSAEAYASLELRAAAAFVALQNNLDLTYSMQRAFTLQNAATKAAEIQMDSLANTAKNFSSALTGMAYKGFEPIIGILQGVMKAATGVIGLLGQVPGLLETIAIAAATLGTVMAASLGLSLLRSLGTMIPVLGAIGAGFTSVTTAVATSTGVFAGFTAAIQAVMVLLRANWIGLTITAVTLAVGAFFAWRNKTDELTASIDSLKGRVSELQGAADETGKKINSVEQAIEGVINRRKELESNRPAFDAKVDELRMQFTELGLSIRGNVNNVTDLIRELNNLKSASASAQASQLNAAASSQAELVAALDKKRDQIFKGNSDIYSDINNAVVQLQNANRYDASGTTNLELYKNQIGQRLGPQVQAAIDFATGKKTDDAEYAVALGNNVDALISQLRLRDAEGNKRDIEFLQGLSRAMQPMIAITADLASARLTQENQLDAFTDKSILGSNAAREFNNSQSNIETGFKNRLLEINSAGLTADDKATALRDLYQWLERTTSVTLQKFADDVKTELGDNVDSDRVLKVLTNNIKKARSSIYTQLGVVTEEQVKNLTKDLRTTQTETSKTAARKARLVSDAQNQETLDAAVKGQREYLEAAAAEITKTYNELIALTTDPDKKAQLIDDRDAAISESNAQLAENARLAAEKNQGVIKDSLERQKTALSDVAKGTQEEIDRALVELSKMSPGAAMNALVEKIKQLNAKLQGELNTVNGISTQIQGINTGTPISAATSANAQGIIAALMQAGLSKNGAAAVAGNLSLESSFNPNAKGDIDPTTGMPTAFGLAQWRGSRWREFTGSTTDPWNTTNQLNFLMKELQRDNPDLFARLQAGNEDAGALAEAFMKQFERPNADPSINHVQDRINSAQAFATSSTSATDAQIKENEQKLTVATDQNNAEFLKANNDATIKSLNARLANLKTQVKVNGDVSSVDELKTKIEALHKEILEKDLASFDAEFAKLKTENPEAFAKQREELQTKLRANMNADVLQVMEEYYKAAEDNLDKPVNAAKAELSAAQSPDVANKYTTIQMQQLQQKVTTAEREAEAKRVLLVEQQIADVRARAAEAEKTFGVGSDEALAWRTRENELLARNAELKTQVTATNAAVARSEMTVSQAVQNGTQAWAQQNGLVDAAGKMVPLAQQVGSSWTEMLGGLSGNLSTFFTNATNGTMSLGDAFKQLGTDILATFSQIIAKALANQIIMSLFGGASGGGWMQSLFGVVGSTAAATGGAVRMATGGSPFRDGGNYKLMPGEFVMRQSAVKAIGVNKLDEMNNLGNRRISQSDMARAAARPEDSAGGGGTVNVWVVSQDQVPPTGPRDIIATVAQNIQNRGTIKQLIQSVQMGQI